MYLNATLAGMSEGKFQIPLQDGAIKSSGEEEDREGRPEGW